MAGAGGEARAAGNCVSYLQKSPRRYQLARALILERLVLLEKAGVDFLKPCSGGDDEPCWVRNHLPALNEVFTKAALEMTVQSAAGLAINPALGFLPKEQESVIAGFFKDWLLDQHVCIHELRLKGPDEACWVLTGVRRLDVSDVLAKSVVKAVKGGRRLESIRVDGAENIEDEVDDLASALRGSACLKNLELSSNYFPPGSFKKIFEALSTCDKLESLSLQDEHIYSGDVRALHQLLHKSSSLKKLELAGIEETYITTVIYGAVEGSSLQELHIFCMEYASDVHASLPLSFAGTLGNLRVLSITWNIIKHDVAVDVAEHLTRNTSLKELDLSANNVGEAGALALAAALKENTTLELLRLIGNDLSPSAFLAFAEALNVNKTLKELNISEIDLSDESSNQLFDIDLFPGLFKRAYIFWQQARLKELATILRANDHHSLLSVMIGDRVSPSDLEALFDALSINTTVKTLNFRPGCKLFPALASRLASFLKANTSVECVKVRLDANSEELLLEILQALKDNTVIWRCDASCVEVTTAVASAVRDLLKVNATLNTLSFSRREDKRLDSEPLLLVADGLRENKTIVDIQVARAPAVVDSLPEIRQLLARNKSLVSLAALCVNGTECSPESVEAFKVTRKSHALVEKVAEMSGKTEERAMEAIAEAAGRFLDS